MIHVFELFMTFHQLKDKKVWKGGGGESFHEIHPGEIYYLM